MTSEKSQKSVIKMKNSASSLNENEKKVYDFLKERGWEVDIHPYFDDGSGEMNVTTPNKEWDCFHSDEEISAFFRAISLFLKSA